MKVENQETGDFDSGNELYDDNSTMNNSLAVDDTINTWIGEPEETMSTLEINQTSLKRVLTDLEYTETPLKRVRFASHMKDIDVERKLHTRIVAERKQKPLSHNLSLKTRVNQMKKEVGVLQSVKKYRNGKDLDPLIEKWKLNGQMAANHLFNDAKIKIERMGGIMEFKKRERKLKNRQRRFEFDDSMILELDDYMRTDEFQSLDNYDKQGILERKQQLEDIQEKFENESDKEDNDGSDDDKGELTLEELFKQMKMDINLFF